MQRRSNGPRVISVIRFRKRFNCKQSMAGPIMTYVGKGKSSQDREAVQKGEQLPPAVL